MIISEPSNPSLEQRNQYSNKVERKNFTSFSASSFTDKWHRIWIYLGEEMHYILNDLWPLWHGHYWKPIESQFIGDVRGCVIELMMNTVGKKQKNHCSIPHFSGNIFQKFLNLKGCIIYVLVPDTIQRVTLM